MQLYDSYVGGSIILVYGGHQQRIGGPLPGATVIANFLAQYQDAPGRPQPFGGRAAGLQRLDDWLRSPEESFFLVAALPGRGKSALLARWCEHLKVAGDQRLRVVFVPISIRFDFNRPEAVLRAVATRLAEVHDEPAFGESVDDWRDLVSELMQRPPPAGTRVLLVLDGLDEAAPGWTAWPSLWPRTPHPDVKIVGSARLTATHPRPPDWLSEMGWDAAAVLQLESLDQEGVRDVLSHMGLSGLAGTPDVVAGVHEASGGDPLALGLYVAYLAAHPFPGTEATVAWLRLADPGLAGFLDRWWADQETLWPDRATGLIARRVFNLLSCAFGPLDREDLLGVARRTHPLSGEELDDALAALDRLVLAPSPRVYAVAHPRLSEHRLTRLTEDGDLEPIERDFLLWAADSLELTTDVRPYVLRHYGQHLQRAEAGPDRMLHLLGGGWRSAWLMVTDDLAGWMEDVDRVHASASRADAVAIAAGNRPHWPWLRPWCTFLHVDAGSTDERVGGDLAAVLVREGHWSERKALARCARIESSWSRAEYLAALAPELSSGGAHLAAQIASTLHESDDPAVDAFAAVAERLVTTGELPAARALAEQSPSRLLSAAGRVALLPALSPQDQEDTLRQLARTGVPLVGFATHIDRELARTALEDPPWRFLERQLQGKEHWWPAGDPLEHLDAHAYAYALGELAPWMSPAEQQQHIGVCLDGLAAYPWPYNVDDALKSIAPYLDGDAWRRAHAVARDLLGDQPRWRLLAEAALLPYAQADAHARLLRSLSNALPELLRLNTPGDVREALSTLASEGAADPVLEALSELDGQNWDKAGYLAAVAPHLDARGVERALAIVADTRRETREEAVAALLARQAECGEIDAAMAGSSAGSDPDEVRAALAVLRVASGRDDFRDAVPALVAIEDRPLRVAAAAVAARLCSPSGADLLSIVSSFGDPIRDGQDVLPMEAFALVASEIPQDGWADLEALRTAGYMLRRGLHPQKSQLAVEYFRRFAAARGVEATLAEALRSCSDDGFDVPLAWATTAVAPLLEPGMGVDRSALREAASTHLPVVLAATLGLVPPLERPGAFEEAIAAWEGPVELRLGTVALFLEALPHEYRETATAALVPDALLDGQSRFHLLETWADQVADLCPSLDPARLTRVLEASERVASGSSRGGLRAAVALRYASLGQVATAVEILDWLEREQVATVLRRVIEVSPSSMLGRLTDEMVERLPCDYWRGLRALTAASLGRRIGELPADQLSQLLDRWHERRPGRDELLVDLLVEGPALLALGGRSAVADFLDRLAPRLTGLTTDG